jgi:NADPH2:quinone reductase
VSNQDKVAVAKDAGADHVIARGLLNVRIGGTYPLAEASRAHADMESRTTTGKLLLIP